MSDDETGYVIPPVPADPWAQRPPEPVDEATMAMSAEELLADDDEE